MSASTKLVSAVASAFLALSLVACGGSKATTEPDTAEQAETAEQATTEKIDMAAEGYVKGTYDGKTYTSDFFGFSYTLPDGYAFATEEEVAELNSMTAEAFQDDELNEALESGVAVIEMSAKDPQTNSNINMSIERFDPAIAEEYSVQQITDQVFTNIKDDNSALEALGCTDITSKLTTVDVNGKEATVVETHAKNGDVELSQYYFIIVAKNFICNICCTATNATDMATTLSGLTIQ